MRVVCALVPGILGSEGQQGKLCDGLADLGQGGVAGVLGLRQHRAQEGKGAYVVGYVAGHAGPGYAAHYQLLI